MTPVIDVAVVDDHPIILESAASWIRSGKGDIRLVATASTVTDVLAGPGSSWLNWLNTWAKSPGSLTACASEKLPRLTGREQISLCTPLRWLASQSPRIVRTTGLSRPNKNRLR